MKRRNMTNIDLRLLSIVHELNKTRSVSQAAENLELSQSAVSMSLARLRRHFKDPLFVRTSEGMEPTPQMLELIGLLEKAEGLLETALVHRIAFHPLTSDRTFRIGATDIIRLTTLPLLMRRLHAAAPSVGISLEDLAEQTPRQLESGRLDLAIGVVASIGSGFCQQRLFADRFVCAVRTNHPRIHDTLTLAQFESEYHLVLSTPGSGLEVLERALEANRIRRKVRLTVPGCFGISSLITGADCLAVIPEQLGRIVAASGRIKLVALPFPLPVYDVVQHWHERYTHDPANKWIRGVIAELFREKEAAAAAPDNRKSLELIS
ncbi:MAG TPA: LysR family transcriptional regulator [Bryobacteraceae bacterium]|nr:LysR family transcriptional regulator [Bryobacteraceae bacterium]HUO29863.1 LysR family transcriptional regulator [Bryobacteraceae bacterium]